MKPPTSIFLCCHREFSFLPPLCTPVQGGAAIHPEIFGAAPDFAAHGGISEKNSEYCELTVQYYAWKNIQANAYGFCHYRRFFCFDDSVKAAYLVKNRLSKKEALQFFKTEDEVIKYLAGYDIVVPYAEDMGISVREHYCTSKFHYKQDLDLFVRILYELFPELRQSTEEYLSQKSQYLCNMFVMSKHFFEQYCEFLFPILEEFDRQKELHGDFQSDRADGYLGERFLGIYINYVRKQGAIIKEVSRVDIGCSLKKRLLYALFPPESHQRFVAKKFAKWLRSIV